jgi:hypothetical protein
MIEDLIREIHNKEEEIEELKNDIENNYEPRRPDPYDEFGVSKYDFL